MACRPGDSEEMNRILDSLFVRQTFLNVKVRLHVSQESIVYKQLNLLNLEFIAKKG